MGGRRNDRHQPGGEGDIFDSDTFGSVKNIDRGRGTKATWGHDGGVSMRDQSNLGIQAGEESYLAGHARRSGWIARNRNTIARSRIQIQQEADKGGGRVCRGRVSNEGMVGVGIDADGVRIRSDE